MSAAPTFPVGDVDALWTPRDDDVMGGHSRSHAEVRDGVLTFAGATSLDDNGGFASIRARGAFGLADTTALRLRLRGDGRAYQLRLATDARHRGSPVSWRGDLDTRAGVWHEATVAFADMRPTYRGTTLDGPALDLAKVEEIGLLIADGHAGDFALDVAWIRAVP
ncbi:MULTISPECIES: CIA30 family protein [Luteimonas]|uniref:CIA30 family protein n=1 Tax=Luteimonas TaxID=83614 RepID=UPI000C79CD9E|nr:MULTISPECIES: CIA30 family protein [Luteimonas]